MGRGLVDQIHAGDAAESAGSGAGGTGAPGDIAEDLRKGPGAFRKDLANGQKDRCGLGGGEKSGEQNGQAMAWRTRSSEEDKAGIFSPALGPGMKRGAQGGSTSILAGMFLFTWG
jgi:hypothetical protein